MMISWLFVLAMAWKFFGRIWGKRIHHKRPTDLALSGFTSRQQRVIKVVTKRHFKNLAYIRVAGEATSPQQLIVYTDSNDDRDLLMKEVKDGLCKEVEIKVKSVVGFRRVIDLLSSERKLIVGHNFFLGVKTSGLADRPCVEVEVRVDEKRFTTNPTLFLACNHLGIDFTLHVHAGYLAKETELQNCINRLYLSWVSGDVIDLSTGKCTTDSASSNLKVDESAVFIQFTKPELVSKFLEMKEILSRNSDPISVLYPLSNILNREYTHAATYDVYQQICSPSTSKKLFADQAEVVGIKHKTVSSRAEREKKGNQLSFCCIFADICNMYSEVV
ncbi:hypothetical protein RDI58_028822 [Solanum bulbocastanum]|uniref:Uncharacterized protein n=1 Tax=Solanum bulbocastanum TaxID=147425 RepID=A0AAN8SSK5_SOLBU